MFKLKNGSQIMHPIHIHGHSFKVLAVGPAQRCRSITPTPCCSCPGETVDVAFVADNPGKWMFHCHVIEHQETGMMSYLEVV